MSEVIKINAWLPLALVSLMASLAMVIVFFVYLKAQKPWEAVIKKGLLLTAAFFLVLSGLFCCLKMPSNRLLTAALTSLDYSAAESWREKTCIFFSARELIIDYKNAQHPRNLTDIQDNTSCLFFNGFVSTPFIQLEAGKYTVLFSARGGEVEGENAILSVEFSFPGSDSVLRTPVQQYFRVTSDFKSYKMDFSVSNFTIGRVRLHFVNDLRDAAKGQDRNAFIKDVQIWKKR